MRYKNLFWGLLFVAIGVLWLLNNLQIVNISWSDVWLLWPFILVWTGISMIPIKDIYKVILDLIAFAVAIFVLLSPCCKTQEVEIETMRQPDIEIVEITPYETASLSMDAGAGTFVFAPGEELVEVKGLAVNGHYLNVVEKQDSLSRCAEVDLNIHPFAQRNNKKKIYILLNPNPVWNMDLDLGASKSILDLRLFKIREMSIDAGVSDIQLTLGDFYPDVNLEVSTGVSAVKIKVPSTMKCIIQNESALSDMNFEGFKRQANGSYIVESQTDTTKGNIYITLETGVSNIEIIRY